MAKTSNSIIQFNWGKTKMKDVSKGIENRLEAIKKGGNRIARVVTQHAASYAQGLYDAAPYDGVKDVRVIHHSYPQGGYFIRAVGESVWFLEYGAGVYYQGEGYPGEKPEGVSPIGTYGKGHGSEDYWFFYPDGTPELSAGGQQTENRKGVSTSSYITHGNPPCAAMYFAAEYIKAESRRMIEELARSGGKK